MKKHVLTLFVMLFVLSLCGCKGGNDLQEAYVMRKGDDPSYEVADYTVDNTTPYQELITKKVDIHSFAQAYSFVIYPWSPKMSQIAAEVGLECVREISNGALYSVHEVEQGGLLYIFYNNEEWREEGKDRPVLRWFYVREDLCYADFEKIVEEGGTMDDVIKIDETEQIFYNIHSGEWIGEEPPELFPTWHYLSDGILELGYQREGDTFVVVPEYCQWFPEFTLIDWQAARCYPINAEIFEFDWLEQ